MKENEINEQPKVKFCKDCKWCRIRWWDNERCFSPKYVDLITGETKPLTCKGMRLAEHLCGRSASLFEPKETKVEEKI